MNNVEKWVRGSGESAAVYMELEPGLRAEIGAFGYGDGARPDDVYRADLAVAAVNFFLTIAGLLGVDPLLFIRDVSQHPVELVFEPLPNGEWAQQGEILN